MISLRAEIYVHEKTIEKQHIPDTILFFPVFIDL